tara:strand:- start:879 stop:1436 length:558 start_codon:yes stop_codon:yes gene_type:complete
MGWLFLQNAGQVGGDVGVLATIFAAFLGLFIFLMVLAVLAYFYVAFALLNIAKRTNTPHGWFAFIPLLNLYLISRIAKMHWWPFLLIVAYIIFIMLASLGDIMEVIGSILGVISLLVFVVYSIIWQWKMFEAVGRPGWWILTILIPFVGNLVYFILLGVAAWGKPENHVEQIKGLKQVPKGNGKN